MSIKDLDNATQLLLAWQSRDHKKSNEFLQYAYQDIRQIVAKYQEQHSPNETLLHDAGVTELSAEAFVKLHRWRNDEQSFENRKQFFDYVRVSVWHLLFGQPHQAQLNKQAAKQSYMQRDITEVLGHMPQWDENLDLSKALAQLQVSYPRQSEVFELKHFAMVSHTQISELLQVSARTVDNDLKFATVWLRAKLKND
ncbi:hypothetical protein DBZ36_18075 [Alginatibacterium sediminis]|uniref:RNA polymerase sigma-70 ECF-like HTH domain-containing protein n=1 Tax=Alginatibacterium sediminis TaxID=2164068 RepID=A0A420E6I9_9ALTE|nr:ECF-type sigma factor [Alginatibacterium sediminis]RKF13680.1 hypothetical protein DBZ36_18075 [Alginatibacterium sediminis]